VISADLPRLKRAVANLIENAIKYTPSGGEVRVSVQAAGTGLTIAVTDSGIGIDARDRARVFDRFFRADDSRSTPGNGLGLSLAEAIVRAHGGSITVDSEPGDGSRFAVRLPCARAPADMAS